MLDHRIPVTLIFGLMAAGPSAGQPPEAARQRELLKRFPDADLNKDGKLTREEFRKYRLRMKKNRAGRGPLKRYRPEDMVKAYEPREFQGVPYRLLKPPAGPNTAGKKFPLVLSLHGAGGKGKDNRKSLKPWNGVFTEAEFQKAHPCYVVVPQSTSPWRIPGSVPELTDERIAKFPRVWRRFVAGRRRFTADDSAGVLHKVFELLDALQKEFPIDPDRVYVLGHSMGGFGAFECLAIQPNRFAAAVASAGGLSPWHDPAKFTHVPIWAFHGERDTTVPIGLSRTVFERMKRSNGNMKFTPLAGVGHGASVFAFSYTGDRPGDGFKTQYSSSRCDRTPSVWDWLFRQRRK